VNSGALEGFEVGIAQDAGDLAADERDELEFLFDVAFVVVESGGEVIGVAAEEGGIIFDEDAFHAIGEDGFKIGEVADDLLDGPFAWDWVFIPIVRCRLADGVDEFLGALFVLLEEFIEGHGEPLICGIGVMSLVKESRCVTGAGYCRSLIAGAASASRMGRPTGVVSSFALSIPS
jgi:hypothetical protein